MKSVLLTGATGFIGQQCLPALLAHDYEVHAVSSKDSAESRSGVHWHQADLLDARQVSALFTRVHPTHLLHLAWYYVPEKWTTSHEHLLWVQASLELLRQFYEFGGKRVVMAGSCAEYDWQYGYCSEFVTPTAPNTFYGTCKNVLRAMLEAYSSETGLSGAWGRIFFLYGPHEHPTRLVSSVIRSLLKNEAARCSHGNQIRDYLHVQDAGSALVALLNSDVFGPVNIASGHPIALKDIICKLASKLDRKDLIELGVMPTPAHDPNVLIASVDRLSLEVGWQPQYDLEHGLDQTIHWWKIWMQDAEARAR